jgi:hypothetical protein
MRTRIDVLRKELAYLALVVLAIGSSFTPLMAGTTVVYNIHVDIICLACPLSNLRVRLSDEAGRVVAERTIPDVFEITLSYTTTTPVNSLTVYATGLASFGAVSGSSIVTVGYGGDYWTAVQLR